MDNVWLVIDTGCVILMSEKARFICHPNSRLSALGSPTRPIKFLSQTPSLSQYN